jgi:plasmid stabilization system protein ParE
MATVIWALPAQAEKEKLYRNGRLQFGITVANKTAHKIEEIQESLKRFPKMGFLEPLLQTRIPTYRAWHINDRFKIIYWYDEAHDMVVIEDIWDTRRNPKTLTRRIKRQ